MLHRLIKYEEPLFRPPAEAYSTIFQVTKGCSWNKCSFCEMYKTKKFEVVTKEKVTHDIETISRYYNQSKKFFLADGNALCMETKDLSNILDKINSSFARVQRVSCYASPRDILSKSIEELKTLHSKGLKLFYTGIESGSNNVLEKVNKGETAETTIEALLKVKKAGIDVSVMILLGLGGKELSHEHAIESARVVNATQPKYLSTLVLELPYGVEHFQKKFRGNYTHLSEKETIKEMLLFIENLNLESTIFRSDHISNLLVLKAVLNKDQAKLVQTIKNYLDMSG